jgi:succinate dehydrogenase / fumarate reductase flavoprotein subunit
MTQKCSVFRNEQNLQEALAEIRQLKKRCLTVGLKNKSDCYNYELQEAFELSNMLKVAEVIVYSALHRRESRGAHFRSDFPERNDKKWLVHSFINETPTGFQVAYKPVTITRFAPQARSY